MNHGLCTYRRHRTDGILRAHRSTTQSPEIRRLLLLYVYGDTLLGDRIERVYQGFVGGLEGGKTVHRCDRDVLALAGVQPGTELSVLLQSIIQVGPRPCLLRNR